MLISVLTTMYCSEDYVLEFYKRIKKTIEKIRVDAEIIFVDDGYPDKSVSIVKKIMRLDSKVKLIELSKNFGHHQAILTGLAYVHGDMVFLIDCDLEEPPELLIEFYDKIKKYKCDVVYGVQNERKGGLIERLSGSLFYNLMNKLSAVDIPRNLVTARLMTNRYVKSLLQYDEKVIFLGGIFSAVGYEQIPVIIHKRDKGVSSYSISKKIKLAIDSMTSFSEKPLLYVFNLGFFISIFSSIYIASIVMQRLFFHISLHGWASIVGSIWLFGGLTLASIGLVGMYVARIFLETKNRPRAIVKNTSGFHHNALSELQMTNPDLIDEVIV
jgi:putative glycosyltransferase